MNHKEIAKVVNELDIVNSKIQDIYQSTIDTYIFELYHPKNKRMLLLVKLTGSTSRIHLVESLNPYRHKKGERPKRFLQHLKANIKNQTIKEFTVIPNDRIVKMTLNSKLIFIRLYSGSMANMIVTDLDHKIIEAAYRRVDIAKTLIIDEPRYYDCDDVVFTGSSYNNWLEKYYLEIDIQENLETLIEKANAIYKDKIARINRRLSSINKTLNNLDLLDSYIVKSRLLQENRYKLSNNIKSITLDDYDGTSYKIDLNEKLNINDNIETYFKKIKKEKNRIELAKSEKDNINSIYLKTKKEYEYLIENKSRKDLNKYISTNVEKKEIESEFLTIKKNDCVLIIGKSDIQNDKILRTKVRGNDFWLHSRDTPGSHVFIKCSKDKTPSLDVILFAAQLAIYYSKARNKTNADLYYTQVKYLRRIKNGPKGKVIPTQEKNITIKVDNEIVVNYFNSANI